MPPHEFSRSFRQPASRTTFGSLPLNSEMARLPPQVLAALCSRYELDMDMSSIPGLMERFGVRFYEPTP